MIDIDNSKPYQLNDRLGVKSFVTDPHFDFKDKAVVVLGNSPAVADLDQADLDKVLTIGVNRILRSCRVDVVLFTDPQVVVGESKFYREFGGKFLTWHLFMERYSSLWIVKERAADTRYFVLGPEARVIDIKTGARGEVRPDMWVWPNLITDPIIRQESTPPYALQLAVLGGAKAIGMIGVDLSAPDLSKNKKDTHFFGSPDKDLYSCKTCSTLLTRSQTVVENTKLLCGVCGNSGLVRVDATGAGGWSGSPHHQSFFKTFPRWASKFPVQQNIFNLSPFEDTPIHKAGWPKLTLNEFVNRFGG